jgi:hypothetical protein
LEAKEHILEVKVEISIALISLGEKVSNVIKNNYD